MTRENSEGGASSDAPASETVAPIDADEPTSDRATTAPLVSEADRWAEAHESAQGVPSGLSQMSPEAFGEFITRHMAGGSSLAGPRYKDELPPSLCEAGPCRHLFKRWNVADISGALDGSIVEPLVEEELACAANPTPDKTLPGTPVLRCSRYEPIEVGDGERHAQAKAVDDTRTSIQLWMNRNT